MNLRYTINKRFSGFLQKYRLKTQFRNVRKLFIFLFIVWVLGSLLTIISQWLFTSDLHASFHDYLKYFWVVIIELVSGFDIPDDIHLNVVSQFISIVMLVMGIVVVGLFTGQIISILVHVLQKAELLPEKPENFQFEKPIIICGRNRKLHNIIANLRKSIYSKNREIVVIDKASDQIRVTDRHYYKDVWQLKGEPADRKILEKAIGKNDSRVIILSQDSDCDNNSSSNTIKPANVFSIHTCQ